MKTKYEVGDVVICGVSPHQHELFNVVGVDGDNVRISNSKATLECHYEDVSPHYGHDLIELAKSFNKVATKLQGCNPDDPDQYETCKELSGELRSIFRDIEEQPNYINHWNFT